MQQGMTVIYTGDYRDTGPGFRTGVLVSWASLLIGGAGRAFGGGSKAVGATTRTTAHGAQRLANAGFTDDLIALTKAQGMRLRQADGATVYLREVSSGRFDFIVEGNRGIITAHRNWRTDAVTRVARNHGWEGWP